MWALRTNPRLCVCQKSPAHPSLYHARVLPAHRDLVRSACLDLGLASSRDKAPARSQKQERDARRCCSQQHITHPPCTSDSLMLPERQRDLFPIGLYPFSRRAKRRPSPLNLSCEDHSFSRGAARPPVATLAISNMWRQTTLFSRFLTNVKSQGDKRRTRRNISRRRRR